jgi:hypothetical protein
MEKHFAVKRDFIGDSSIDLRAIQQRLELMEIEGRFEISR